MRIRVVDERRGQFARLRDRDVLIYWPHGLGDWAHLSYVIPFFDQSNRYAIFRYGDDYVSLFEGNAYARPVLSGQLAVTAGAAGVDHFGIDFKRIDGGEREVTLAGVEAPLRAVRFDTLFYTDYPEREGRTAFPFHTKARALLAELVDWKQRDRSMLERPLRSTLSFDVSPQLQDAVDDRLGRLRASGEKLLLLSATGRSAERKNWSLDAVADLQRIVDGESAVWRTLTFDEGEGAASYRALFSDLREPFGRVLKAIVRRADLAIGVPAGPLHVAAAYGRIPHVGIWLAHHPDWYEERSEIALHLLGKGVFDRGFEKRPATRSLPSNLRNRTREFPNARQISAADVWEAAKAVLDG